MTKEGVLAVTMGPHQAASVDVLALHKDNDLPINIQYIDNIILL